MNTNDIHAPEKRRTQMRCTMRRGIAGAAMGAVAAVVLAGCAVGGAAGNGELDASQVSTTITDEPVTLTISYVNDPPTESLVEAFEEKYPNVTVETTLIPFGDYIKSINRSMASDNPPDIAQFNGGAMRSLIPAGLVYNLDPYSEAYGWDKTIPSSTVETYTTDVSTGAKQLNTGGLYAVPGGLSVLGVFYNTDLLAQAGVEEVPTTLAEFEQTLQAVQDAGTTPFSLSGLEVGGFQLWQALTEVLGPVDDYKDWVYGAPDATIETAAAKDAAQKIIDWTEAGYIPSNANAVSDSDALANFAQGKAAFLLTGNWNTSALMESMGDGVGFFVLPGVEADAAPVAPGSSVAFSISSKTKHPDVAAAFLDFISSADAAQLEVDGGYMPVNTETEVQAAGVNAQVVASFADVIAGDGIVTFPGIAAPGMISQLQPGVQGLISGHVTPEAFVKSLQEEWSSFHD
ncbi:MAG: ABC transporter substrate-binding protein [Microbacterium sp.]